MRKSSGARSILSNYIALIAAILIFSFPGLIQAVPNLAFTDPTEANNATIYRNWTIINITISEPLFDSFIFNWLVPGGNWSNTTYTNLSPEITAINLSDYSFYLNKTSLSDGTYDYYGWANDTSGNFSYTEGYNSTSPRRLVIDGFSPYYLTNCANLSVNGATYYLTANITNSETSYCMNISANNVTLDCQNNLIDGTNTPDYGIYVSRESAQTTGITIRNCRVTDWGQAGIYLTNASSNILVNITANSNSESGIYIANSFSNSFANITADSNSESGIYLAASDSNNFLSVTSNKNTDYGICLWASNSNNITSSSFGSGLYGVYFKYDSDNNILANSTIYNSSIYGIYFMNETEVPEANKIYNCLLNETNPFGFSGGFPGANYFNSTNQTGTRILGNGNNIGGNFYTNSTGGGFSVICGDSNGDGFCDDYYNAATNNACTAGTCGNNTDFLALSDGYYSDSFSIQLNSPDSNKFTNDTTPDFNFTVSGTESTYNCSLYINGTGYGRNSSAMNNTATTLIANHSLINGTYTWYLNCTSTHIYRASEARQITVDTVRPRVNFTCSFTTLKRNEDQTCDCSATDNISPEEDISLSYLRHPSTQSVGNKNVSCTATDQAGNSNTSLFIYSVTGVSEGSGGGSGSGGASGAAANKIRFETNDTDISVEVYLNDTLNSPSLTIEKIPSVRVISPSGLIYQFLNITKSNFENGNIRNSSITFRVTIEWMGENNITSVYMAHYNGTAWVKLKTDQLENRGNYAYFMAYTDSFSYYAIIGVNNTCSDFQTRCFKNAVEVCQNNTWKSIKTCPNGCNQTTKDCSLEPGNTTNTTCHEGGKRCNYDTLEECKAGNWNYLEVCESGCDSSSNICLSNKTFPGEAKSSGSQLYMIIVLGLVAVAAAGTYYLNKSGRIRLPINGKSRYEQSVSESVELEAIKIEKDLAEIRKMEDSLKLDKEDRRDPDSS